MMPDLGKYAVEVTSAYGITFLLILIISFLYWRRGLIIKRRLMTAEARKDA